MRIETCLLLLLLAAAGQLQGMQFYYLCLTLYAMVI